MADRRQERHQGTRERILEAAWALARERGLTGWSLRDLGAAVGMKAPSLYVYFAGKDEIYDAMFAQGYQDLLSGFAELRRVESPREQLRVNAHAFFSFCVSDPARMQLLFQRVIPGFVPSEGAYELAGRALDLGTRALAAADITDPAATDLWTALLTGLANQQVSNDPGGDRWARLVDRAVDGFLAHEGQ